MQCTVRLRAKPPVLLAAVHAPIRPGGADANRGGPARPLRIRAAARFPKQALVKTDRHGSYARKTTGCGSGVVQRGNSG